MRTRLVKKGKDYAELRKERVRLSGGVISGSDPLQPRRFRQTAEAIADCRRLTESAWQGACTSKGQQKADFLSKIDALVLEGTALCNDAFRQFLRAIGLEVSDEVVWDKAAADRALEGAIGSTRTPGDHWFRYPGVVPLNMEDDRAAAQAFSLYLARKGFGMYDPRNLAKETSEFLKRVTVPRPVPDAAARDRLVLLTRRFARLFFSTKNPSKYKGPCNSGKACLERSRSEGGKRECVYGEGPDPRLRGLVKPVTILSAGKPRTITITSARQERYAFLNRFMFNRMRGMSWMVAGRTVESWAEECGESMCESEWFSCGDGKACTDYFDPVFAEAVIEHLASVFFPGDEEALEDMLSETTRARLTWTDETGRECFAQQQAGQLMGSNFSFPILCWVSFLAHLESVGKVPALLAMSDADFKVAIATYKKVGVNGDDLASSGGPAAGAEWEDAFAKVGGVASPAKSPCDTSFLTINSQLWRRDGKKLKKIWSLLPAMLLGVCGKAHLAPDEAWVDFLRSPLLTPEVIYLFELDLLMGTDIPRALGGLGVSSPHGRCWCGSLNARCRHWLDRVLWHCLANPELRFPDHLDTDTSVKSGPGGTRYVGELHDRQPTDRLTGFVERHVRDACVRHHYSQWTAVQWTQPSRKAIFPADIRRAIVALDGVTRAKVLRDAIRAQRLEAEGLVYVHNLPVAADAGDFKYVATHKLYRTAFEHIKLPKRTDAPVYEPTEYEAREMGKKLDAEIKRLQREWGFS